MIKNLIFDFGQVLARYNPAIIVGNYVANPEDSALLQKTIFDRLYWDRLDAGTISDDELMTECKKRLPERLHKVAETIYQNWVFNLPEIEGMRELVCNMRDKFGLRVFVLSNAGIALFEHAKEISIFSEFEGYIISAECGYIKPNTDIFEYACKTWNITPAETVFIDDTKVNIIGAEAAGLIGYHFDGNVALLEDYLKRVILAD